MLLDDFNTASYLAAGILLAILLLSAKSLSPIQKTDDEIQEPPFVWPTIPIPLIGHLLGLLWQRAEYYTNISLRHNLPIVSISMLGGKVYIIGSAEIMHTIQRHPKAISFWYVESVFAAQLGAMSKQTTKALVDGWEPGTRQPNVLMAQGLKAIHHALTPVGGMDEMNKEASIVMSTRLDDLIASQEALPVDLWEWVQHEITVATTQCVYGPRNPYQDPKVESGFWDFADGTINLLLAQYLPFAGASKALAGRETVTTAMQNYFAEQSYLEGSSLARARVTMLKNHIPHSDLARFETVNGIGMLANTVPTAFWAIFHIFSDPNLLKKVRSQVEAISSASESGSFRTINLKDLKEAPIISSVIQEALRQRATGAGPRMVMEDIKIGNNLLKKGNFAIIAHKALHFNRAAWGDNAEDFDAERFNGKVPSHAFRGFGGGANMCPGKAFAMTEVAALLAMLVLRFDLEPVGEGGWKEPGQDITNMSLQIGPPLRRPIVRFVARPEVKKFAWSHNVILS